MDDNPSGRIVTGLSSSSKSVTDINGNLACVLIGRRGCAVINIVAFFMRCKEIDCRTCRLLFNFPSSTSSVRFFV